MAKRCRCGKALSQPYAQRMGECVACYLKRRRAGRDIEWYLNALKVRERVAARRRRGRELGLAA